MKFGNLFPKGKGGRLGVLLGLITVAVVAGIIILSGFAAKNPYYKAELAHHTPKGFKNNYPHAAQGNFMKWMWERFWGDLPANPPPCYKTPRMPVDMHILGSNPGPDGITWIGHATLLLRIDGVSVITDPMFSQRASPFSFAGPKRYAPPALALQDLPRVDVVLISHNHYDHLDLPSVKHLAAQPGGSPTFFVPLGLKPWFTDLGITEVVELDWWDSRKHLGLEIVLLPVQHFSARTLFNTNRALWGAWAVLHPGFRFYFGGDSGYSKDFVDIGRRLGPFDLAAIPIGAYEPRWFMNPVHINPEEAVLVHRDIGARQSIAMHWGTFILTDEALDEPPKKLVKALALARISTENFKIIKIGETLPISVKKKPSANAAKALATP